MAASDPTPYVATPTGTLQGVAAFSWDGSVWQPSGRAGPDVATPTGVLQGVAPFSWSGSAWTPAGQSQPGVATPSGVLDGVAVYTWSGSAWTPASGTATPSTPSGALRGVAAFSWDGAAWQPAAQARASVPTPYGALDGVAMFEWGGSTWQAGAAVPAGATLDLSFLSGTLDPSLTFTRGSTATYFDSSGVMQTAATNAPRFDYDPTTHALNGLLIEEQRTNVLLNSDTIDPTGNCIASADIPRLKPAATLWKLTWGPAGQNGAVWAVNQTVTIGTTYTATCWIYIPSAYNTSIDALPEMDIDTGGNGTGGFVTPILADGTKRNQWQRLTTTFMIGTGGATVVNLVVRRGNAFAGPMTGGSIMYTCCPQLEAGAFPTSYIPTTAAAVTRSADVCTASTTPWYNTANAAGTLQAEALLPVSAANNFWQMCAVIDDNTNNNRVQLFRSASSDSINAQISRLGVDAYNAVIGTQVAGVAWKGAVAYQSAAQSTAFNGVLGPGNTAAMSPIAVTLLHVGHNAGPGLFANGYIRRVRYWPRVLSNAELQSVTT